MPALAGLFPQDTWYDRLLTPAEGDVFVTKPDGAPLLCVLRGALAGGLYRAAYRAIVPLARSTPQDNRGLAAGRIWDTEPLTALKGNLATRQVGKRSKVRYFPVKRDGTVSNTSYAKRVASFVMGYTDRSARFPYCRQTVYTHDYPERLVALLPCVQQLTALMQAHVPLRHAAQAAAMARVHPDFVIPGTVFTTLTINRNFQTALHRDAGDLAAGFGVMACWRRGTYTGGYYCMPQFRIAVDLHAGDVLLSDVHEWHANTPLVGDPTHYERLTMVCYMREKMVHCGSQAAELAQAQARGLVPQEVAL
jgi:hypothetical protein